VAEEKEKNHLPLRVLLLGKGGEQEEDCSAFLTTLFGVDTS